MWRRGGWRCRRRAGLGRDDRTGFWSHDCPRLGWLRRRRGFGCRHRRSRGRRTFGMLARISLGIASGAQPPRSVARIIGAVGFAERAIGRRACIDIAFHLGCGDKRRRRDRRGRLHRWRRRDGRNRRLLCRYRRRLRRWRRRRRYRRGHARRRRRRWRREDNVFDVRHRRHGRRNPVQPEDHAAGRDQQNGGIKSRAHEGP